MKQNIKYPYYVFLITAILLSSCNIIMSSCKKENKDSLVPDSLSGVSVKVMTYNIYSGRMKGIDAIAEVIREADPDLVGLQEVETNTDDFDFNVLEKLSELTGMQYYYFAKALDLPRGEYGNLILSKYPITDVKTHRLDLDPAGVTSNLRSLGIVQTEIEGKTFYFATTHLDHTSDNLHRLFQIDQIHSFTKDLTSPIIMSGDFNATPATTPMQNIQQWFKLGCLNEHCGFTSKAPKPNSTIDYLMFAPMDAMTTKSYDVYYQAFSQSDHFPVVATFIIH